MYSRRAVDVLLALLVLFDLVLVYLTLIAPERWFEIMHAGALRPTSGFMQRTGAVWAAFTLLQAAAFLCWERRPWWLVLIAGVRLTELFSDWTYWAAAAPVTTVGAIGLCIAPPANLFFGWYLVRCYLRRTAAGPSRA